MISLEAIKADAIVNGALSELPNYADVIDALVALDKPSTNVTAAAQAVIQAQAVSEAVAANDALWQIRYRNIVIRLTM